MSDMVELGNKITSTTFGILTLGLLIFELTMNHYRRGIDVGVETVREGLRKKIENIEKLKIVLLSLAFIFFVIGSYLIFSYN